MKKSNFLRTILIAVVFTSFTTTTFSDPAKTITPVKQKSTQELSFNMSLSNTNDLLLVNYTNPEGLNLLVKVYDIFGNVLATTTAPLLSGRISFQLSDLEAAGGTGTYTVEMSNTDGGSSKKGTIVIIREAI